MIGKLTNKYNNQGESPVIGVILMVAVVISLVALATVIVFDIGGKVSESPDATVELKTSIGEVVASVLRNENVESFKLKKESNVKTFSANPGSSTRLATGDGQYSVVAVMSDGSEEVLTSSVKTGIKNEISGTI